MPNIGDRRLPNARPFRLRAHDGARCDELGKHGFEPMAIAIDERWESTDGGDGVLGSENIDGNILGESISAGDGAKHIGIVERLPQSVNHHSQSARCGDGLGPGPEFFQECLDRDRASFDRKAHRFARRAGEGLCPGIDFDAEQNTGPLHQRDQRLARKRFLPQCLIEENRAADRGLDAGLAQAH